MQFLLEMEDDFGLNTSMQCDLQLKCLSIEHVVVLLN